MSSLRIVINAQLDPRRAGGIAQVVLGLAHSLSRLDGPEDYLFVCSPESAAWLEPRLGPNGRIEVNTIRKPAPRRGVRESDGFWESFVPDVLHFPYQSFTRTEIPTVFNPHDLQHVHLPHLFSDEERERRESLYTRAGKLASAVAVTSNDVKCDLVRHYGFSSDKIHVIWWGSPSAIYEGPGAVHTMDICEKYDIPRGFAIYPAQTWPHKNHEVLLDALHRLRHREGVMIPLVCTGAQTDHYENLARSVHELRLNEQVRFLGWVDDTELMSLYRSARMMVVPTLFEAISFPVFEAFSVGLPVACSAVTSLPEQVGDAALLFDPRNVDDLAAALLRLYTDERLRKTLALRGRERMKDFSWARTAAEYRDLYRDVAVRGPRRHQESTAVLP